MTIPTDIAFFQKDYKQKLKLTIGNLVYTLEDHKKKRPMVITDFIIYSKFAKTDYLCSGISGQGVIFNKEYREKELIKFEL